MFSLNMGRDPRKEDPWLFGWNMGLALVMPHMRRRRSSAGLNKSLVAAIDRVLLPDDDDLDDGVGQAPVV